MDRWKLGEMELRFARLIWERAPVPSGELVTLCRDTFGWKKSTTYTMLRRLCDRGIFQNQGGQVTARMSEEDFQAAQGEQFLQESFGGSLPRFLAAFSRRAKLSQEDVQELERLFVAYREDA